MIFVFISIYSTYFLINETRNNYLGVYFLDVGQGDSIYIKAPNKVDVLVDSGLNGEVLHRLSKVMPFYDRNIDLIISTHPDLDHIGGFIDVLGHFNVNSHGFYASSKTNEATKAIDILKENKNVSNLYLKAGDRIIIDHKNNIYIDILFPDDKFPIKESNESSLVMKLVYGSNSYLLTGDSPMSVERYLVSKLGEKLRSDVLKVGHHGSKTSTSNELLGFVKPEVAVISSGKENNFGHPHQEVLDLLSNFQIKILNTKDLGTIVSRSFGEGVFFLDQPSSF